jgi:hypothetical protein
MSAPPWDRKSVEERLRLMAAEARQTDNCHYSLDLRVRIYPDRETGPGGDIVVIGEDGRLGPNLMLSHYEHNGVCLDEIVRYVRGATS